MRQLRVLIVLVAAAAIGVAYYSGRDDRRPAAADSAATGSVPPAENSVRVAFTFSSNLEEMLVPLIERFNAERVEVGGRPVYVVGHGIESGKAFTQIVRGRSKPVVWSPASSLWGRLLNHELDAAYVADDNPSLVRSPVVVAMWEPLARALGWPHKPIGFADILELATTKSNWAAFGKPTFGEFRLGHTNPNFSTSGLSFVTAQYYLAAGKREGLTMEDLERQDLRAKVRAIEQSIVHYGDSGSFFGDQLAAKGPGYASAVAMEETTLLEFNHERKPGEMRLAAIYPAEGLFVADNPYIVLDAPWVTPAQRRGAEVFGAWLRDRLTPDVIARFNYRPPDPDQAPLAPITPENGVDPKQPKRVLAPPEPRVLARVLEAWHEDRKPANLLLVVDVSGSMNDEDKIDQARRGLLAFLKQLSPRDRVGLLAFSSRLQPLVGIEEFGHNRATLRALVSELIADGDTALYDATLRGWETVDELNDDTRINAVVVLSDGTDTASSTSLGQLIERLSSRSSGEGRQVRVFTIAYGSDAEKDVLEKIAAASGGKAYESDPDSIEEVYIQISSFF